MASFPIAPVAVLPIEAIALLSIAPFLILPVAAVASVALPALPVLSIAPFPIGLIASVPRTRAIVTAAIGLRRAGAWLGLIARIGRAAVLIEIDHVSDFDARVSTRGSAGLIGGLALGSLFGLIPIRGIGLERRAV